MEIRPLTSHEDFRKAVQLQQEIWGFEDIDLNPARLFVTATRIGGHAFGAWEGDLLAGFCVATPGLKPDGKPYLFSLMLGVRDAFRDRGTGRVLKLRQREDALARGIDLIEWTFDPLEIKNARFNIEKLGVIVTRYVRNYHGATSSPLHGALPTDRCIAEWWLASPRVKSVLAGCTRRPEILERIPVPVEIVHWRHAHPERAREVQERVAEELESAFARGLAVIGFERTEAGGSYLVGRWQLN